MKKLMLSGALVAAMAVPSAAVADEPTKAEFKNASKQCKSMKRAAGAANFKALYKSHGKCVSSIARQKAAKDERQEKQAKRNAAKECKQERRDNAQQFAADYGSKKNAFGKCVSSKAKQNKREADREEAQQDKNRVNAAKQCKQERKDKAQFAQDYGSKRNAFGKCVSKKAKAQNEQDEQEQEQQEQQS